MKNILIEANISIYHTEETKRNITILIENVLVNQLSFVSENLNEITIADDQATKDLLSKHCLVWVIKAKNTHVKVVVKHSSITLTNFENQSLHDLSFYIEIMLCLCENLLIWNMSAQEIH